MNFPLVRRCTEMLFSSEITIFAAKFPFLGGHAFLGEDDYSYPTQKSTPSIPKNWNFPLNIVTQNAFFK
jgi:hypothetical protein